MEENRLHEHLRAITLNEDDEDDWEFFIRKTIHLNKARTEIERIQQFRNQATKSWRLVGRSIPTTEVTVQEGKTTTKPSTLKKIMAGYLKSYLYTKFFIELLDYTTEGYGIYPKTWDSHADEIKEKMLEVRDYGEEEVYQWARDNYFDDTPFPFEIPFETCTLTTVFKSK